MRSYAEQLEVETYFNSKIGSFATYWIGLRQSWARAGSGGGEGEGEHSGNVSHSPGWQVTGS
jgi:hypothetical protein